MLVLVGACSDDRPTEPNRHAEQSPNVSSAGVLRDDFTDADGTLLEDHTPDGGSEPFSWIRAPSFFGSGEAIIQDGALIGGPDHNWIYTPSRPAVDWIELTIDVLEDPTGEHNHLVIWLRGEEDDLDPAYQVQWVIGGVAGNWFDVWSPETGSGHYQWLPVAPGLHTFRAEINPAGEMELSVDGQVHLTHPLGTLRPPGRTGIGMITSTGGPATVRITSFAAATDASTPQAVNVLCSPSNPTRGDSIHCKTSLTVPDSYTVVRRTASGVGFTVEDLTSSTHEPGDTNTWEGIAVAPSDVEVEVQVGTDGAIQNLTNQTPASFGVQARSWPTWQLTTLFGPTKAVVTTENMQDFPLVGTNLGLFQPDYPSAVSLPLSRPSGGPNTGLVYLRDPVSVTGYLVYTHPALYPPTPTTPMGSKQWYRDQNGKGTGTPTPPYCSTSAQIATLAANVERHEGVTKDPTKSHYGVANQQYALLQPQRIFEEMYSQLSDATFQANVDTAFVIFNNTGAYAAAQQTFESQDTGPTLASAGCTFDFNPNDK